MPGTYFLLMVAGRKKESDPGRKGVGLGEGEGREEALNSRRVSRPVLLVDGFLNFVFEFLDRVIAGELAKELAVVEEQHLRNAFQRETLEQSGLLFDIDFIKAEFVLVGAIFRKLFDFGVHVLADMTCLAAEHNQARFPVVVDRFVEIGAIEFLHAVYLFHV